MVYPFKVVINDPELGNIFQRLQRNHSVKLPQGSNMGTRITWKLKPIRPDIVLAPEPRYHRTNLSLAEGVEVNVVKLNDKRFEVLFKKMF